MAKSGNSGRAAASEPELEQALFDLVSSMYLVFENDWEFTKPILEDPRSFIHPEGTFLNPRVDDERNNWGNRGGLLEAYRRAARLLRDRGREAEHV